MRIAIVLGAFAIAFASLTVSSYVGKSATADEPINLTAGYTMLKLKDYRIHPDNMPLLRMWAALPLLAKNPMFVLVRGYRAIFLEGQAPVWGSLWKLWIAAAAVFILGHAWFYKLRRSFADII